MRVCEDNLMPRLLGRPTRAWGRVPAARRATAFTLIEVLVVLSIITLILAILLPVLRASREEAKTIKCLANLRSILQASGMYVDDQEGRQLYPWYQVPPHTGYSPAVVTPWVFGGFRAPKPEADDVYVDSSMYPAQIRPLNKYVDPTAAADPFNFRERGKDVIPTFICPSDRTSETTLIGEPVSAPASDREKRASWEANGSSYTLNTRWMQGYAGFDFTKEIHDPERYAELSSAIARRMVGGDASSFILWAEQGFYNATYNAKPLGVSGDDPDHPGDPPESGDAIGDLPPALPQVEGWHRKFSVWTVGFADGHVINGFYDTRTIYGLGGTIWEPNGR